MIEEKNLEAVEALETVKLVERELMKITKVRMSLDPLTKEEIAKFLKKNLDVFT